MSFGAIKKHKTSKVEQPQPGTTRSREAGRGAGRSKKLSSRAAKTLLSVLVERDYALCALQVFDGGRGRVTAIREFEMDLSGEDTPRPVALSALVSEFIGSKHSVDAAFVYIGENLTEGHRFVAKGMSREDVLAAIGNETFWPNMIVTEREIREQAVSFELFDLAEPASPGIQVEAVFVDSIFLADLEKALHGMKLQCLSIAPIGGAISGCLLDGTGADAVGVDIRSDGRALVYYSGSGRCTPDEFYIPLLGLNTQPFNPALTSGPVATPARGNHSIWGEVQFKSGEPRAVVYCAPQGFDQDILRGSSGQAIKKFDAQIEYSEVNDHFMKVSSERRVAEVIYMAQYTQLLSAASPGDPPRDSDLNFRGKHWGLYDGDRRKTALYRSVLLSGAIGTALAVGITAAAGLFLPNYRQLTLDNELVKSELNALDGELMRIQQEFDMLGLREAAIAQISGNHRDVYAAVISVLGLVPHQIQLSQVSIDGETGDIAIEGIGANEIAVSNFVGLLSVGGRARASLLRISVIDEGGFSFEISVPYLDLL